jgi:hypothetical protein
VEYVTIHLQGGPEQGRELSAPADPAGLPIPRLTVGASVTASPHSQAGQPPLLVYERDHERPDGSWEYRYVGSENRFSD